MSQHHSPYNMGIAPTTYGSNPPTVYSSISSWGTIATNAPQPKITGTPSAASFHFLSTPTSTTQTIGSPAWGPGAIPQQHYYSPSHTIHSPYAASSSTLSSTSYAPTGPVYPPSQVKLISCLRSPSHLFVNLADPNLDLSRYGSQLACSAFEPSMTYATVIISIASAQWKVNLQNPGALTVSDVIRQIHRFLHRQDAPNSDALLHRMHNSVPTGDYRDASYQRDGYAYGTSQRIALLGSHHFFYGLTPAGDGNTWNLCLCRAPQ